MDIGLDTTYKFLGDSASGTGATNTTTNVDYQMTSDYVLYGAELVYKDANFGDSVCFQVIDKDNVLGYGANTILNEWVKKWYVDPGTTRWVVKSQFGSTIPTGLYIRLKYTNISLINAVSLKLNFYFIKQG